MAGKAKAKKRWYLILYVHVYFLYLLCPLFDNISNVGQLWLYIQLCQSRTSLELDSHLVSSSVSCSFLLAPSPLWNLRVGEFPRVQGVPMRPSSKECSRASVLHFVRLVLSRCTTYPLLYHTCNLLYRSRRQFPPPKFMTILWQKIMAQYPSPPSLPSSSPKTTPTRLLFHSL